MANSFFSGRTLDDVMRSVVEEILKRGETITPSKGKCAEITGILIEISDPRSRLSRTETRGRLFSCLGELCWYLAGSNDVEFISYYIPKYRNYAEGDQLFGGYGPRLFDWGGINQLSNIIKLLAANPVSRKAVVQLFDRGDIVDQHQDVSCTCTLQFMIRQNSLHMITSMRSNDVFLGFPHDVFCFTMLQEIVARSLNVALGTYKHAVGSFHLYNKDADDANQFLEEGWQSTLMPMPDMPLGDPQTGIASLLELESAIRIGKKLDASQVDSLDSYWADLVRILQMFRSKKDDDLENIRSLREKMSCSIYQTFIDKALNTIG